MDIRPQQLPEIRAELISFYQNSIVADWWAKRPAVPAMTIHDERGAVRARLNPSGSERRLKEIERLGQADLYFVAANMTDLAVAAAASLPSFNLAEHDIPSRNGFIIFEKPIAVDYNTEGGDGEPMFINGASWSLDTARSLGSMLWFSFYVDLYRTFDTKVAQGAMTKTEAARQKGYQPRLSYTMDAAHLLGRPVANEDSVLNLWGRTILSAWLLMGQPLADVTDTQPDRATQKRLRRAGQLPAPVRVIELRRPKQTGSEHGDSGREYHHKWVVRGHWRQQWYPKHQVHRPVWIAPHVKGPEDAPLLGGDKVYTWKR